MKKISFVIPVYRNEGSIRLTYHKIKQLFVYNLSTYACEFVFTDDGSDDGSLQELISIKEADPHHVKVLSLSRNFGQVSAELAGFSEVTGDAGIRISADLQEPIEKIEQMIREWENGYEIVICHRQNRSDSFLANLSSATFYRIMSLFMPRMPKGGFDFFLLDQKPLEVFNRIDERHRFIQGDLLWLGFRTKFIPYERLKRTIGRSQWTLAKKVEYSMDGMVNASYTGMRMMLLIGLFTLMSGIVYALWSMIATINGTQFTEWTMFSFLLLIIGGLIILMLGIIGEYIWRIYDETRKRPNYIIRKRLD